MLVTLIKMTCSVVKLAAKGNSIDLFGAPERLERAPTSKSPVPPVLVV